MSLEEFLRYLNDATDAVEFAVVLEFIETHFSYSATDFYNGIGEGRLLNKAGTNEGSCKIFALGKALELSEEQTLVCFGQYYQQDVLANPEGTDHGNIRNFMKHGWNGIEFSGTALVKR